MAIFYDRTETPDEIVIVFKYLKLQFITVILLLLTPAAANFNSHLLLFIMMYAGWFMLIWFGLVLIIATEKIAYIEINKATRGGTKVEVSGTRFSSKNPLTYRIKK